MRYLFDVRCSLLVVAIYYYVFVQRALFGCVCVLGCNVFVVNGLSLYVLLVVFCALFVVCCVLFVVRCLLGVG